MAFELFLLRNKVKSSLLLVVNTEHVQKIVLPCLMSDTEIVQQIVYLSLNSLKHGADMMLLWYMQQICQLFETIFPVVPSILLQLFCCSLNVCCISDSPVHDCSRVLGCLYMLVYLQCVIKWWSFMLSQYHIHRGFVQTLKHCFPGLKTRFQGMSDPPSGSGQIPGKFAELPTSKFLTAKCKHAVVYRWPC